MTCEREGCNEEAIECRVDGEPNEYLCPDHAAEAGYCCCCGDFCAGIDNYDFIHPGLCDNCNDEFEADTCVPEDSDDWDFGELNECAVEGADNPEASGAQKPGVKA